MRDLVNLFDYEAAALPLLPPAMREYYAGGANDEVTLRENRTAFDRLRLHYRVLRDVSARTPATTVLGVPVSLPVLVAPTAFHCGACPDGELATARAAGRAGTVMILSTLATQAMEDVVAHATGPVWFQLYVYRDRAVTRDLVRRAEAAGCGAIVLTVDAPVGGQRERDVRAKFRLPDGLALRNLLPAGAEFSAPDAVSSGVAAYVNQLFDPGLSWPDLDWLCAATRLPVLVKGVVRADDALACVEHGARAIVVSNHGGRQLDTAPPAIEVLAEIAAAVGGAAELLLDGGVRRGTDVVKALALGARAVLVGRPVLWGLTVGGEEGVGSVLEILRRELDVAMALCGATTVAELDASLVRPRPW
jgi:4-hydroxymandelate oxidase